VMGIHATLGMLPAESSFSSMRLGMNKRNGQRGTYSGVSMTSSGRPQNTFYKPNPRGL